jgi:hypothetical protein
MRARQLESVIALPAPDSHDVTRFHLSIRGSSVRVFSGSSILAALLCSSVTVAAPSCFTAPEVEAAHLRVLQQQFNVAALNCQTGDPSDPTFSERYNQFIQRFSNELQNNSEILYHHFGKDRSSLDRWMTRVANDAGQKVITNPTYCQQAWDRLDQMIPLAPAAMESYAVTASVAGDLAPLCPEKTSAAKGKPKPPSK